MRSLLVFLAIGLLAFLAGPAQAQYATPAPTSSTAPPKSVPPDASTASLPPETPGATSAPPESVPPTSAGTAAPTGTAAPEVSSATVYDYLSTNASYTIFASMLSKYDDLWPLLAGFPPGTQVSEGTPAPPRKKLWERLFKRQETSGEKYTVLAPTDDALNTLILSNVSYATILDDPYSDPFWRFVVAYQVLNGSHDLLSEGTGSYETLNYYAYVNVTDSNGDLYANSVRVLAKQPVSTGNGLVYPCDGFITPLDYFQMPNGRYADVPWILDRVVAFNPTLGGGGGEPTPTDTGTGTSAATSATV